MAIKHSTTKGAGQKLYAIADWNSNHTADNILVANLNADLLDGNHSTTFVPYSGAISDVDLGNFGLQVGASGITISSAGKLSVSSGNLYITNISTGKSIYVDCDGELEIQCPLDMHSNELKGVGLFSVATVSCNTCEAGFYIYGKDYYAGDWTQGATANVPVAKVGGGTRTLQFKDGLYVGYADS